MAQANFYEILRCVGVDQNVTPPGMIVPFRGSNQVVLETGGMDLNDYQGQRRVMHRVTINGDRPF